MAARASIDSNILVYAELEPETKKGRLAQHVIGRAAPTGVLAAQALLEFVAVVRRRRPESLLSAIAKTEAWSTVFETAPTTSHVVRTALQLAAGHQFQVWDAVIWSASQDAGATLLLTEDLQDGLRLNGMTAVNPFARTAAELAALIGD